MRTRHDWITLAATLVMLALNASCNNIEMTGPPEPLTGLPRSLSSAEEAVISASNSFAFDLLRTVSADEPGQNVFLSPLSVSMSLGMAMNGAAGRTFDEMRDVLGFGDLSSAEVNTAYHDVIRLLLELDPRVDLGIENSIWYRNGFFVREAFIRSAEQFFGAAVSELDFDSPRAVETINDWVARATGRRIESILDRIDPDDVMFLVNAVYFKGSWTDRFDLRDTREGSFQSPAGEVRVPMMTGSEKQVRYRISSSYTAVELPYGNGAFQMTIVMPTADTGIDEFAGSLDNDRWIGIVSELMEGKVDLTIPRFRLEYGRSLVEPLQTLGMVEPFDGYFADFSRLAESSGLYISDVKHRSFIDVDEEGTEAAAVTVTGISIVSSPVIPTITIDRPFIVAIRERFSGAVLFVGKIADPTA